mmetsp:Transcript_104845/g.240362  ORF Transcript_104845/g.240362 Transcript_104845/m.240362 type:complete len:514 (+) Transcript_104845:45-1586(+)
MPYREKVPNDGLPDHRRLVVVSTKEEKIRLAECFRYTTDLPYSDPMSTQLHRDYVYRKVEHGREYTIPAGWYGITGEGSLPRYKKIYKTNTTFADMHATLLGIAGEHADKFIPVEILFRKGNLLQQRQTLGFDCHEEVIITLKKKSGDEFKIGDKVAEIFIVNGRRKEVAMGTILSGDPVKHQIDVRTEIGAFEAPPRDVKCEIVLIRGEDEPLNLDRPVNIVSKEQRHRMVHTQTGGLSAADWRKEVQIAERQHGETEGAVYQNGVRKPILVKNFEKQLAKYQQQEVAQQAMDAVVPTHKQKKGDTSDPINISVPIHRQSELDDLICALDPHTNVVKATGGALQMSGAPGGILKDGYLVLREGSLKLVRDLNKKTTLEALKELKAPCSLTFFRHKLSIKEWQKEQQRMHAEKVKQEKLRKEEELRQEGHKHHQNPHEQVALWRDPHTGLHKQGKLGEFKPPKREQVKDPFATVQKRDEAAEAEREKRKGATYLQTTTLSFGKALNIFVPKGI